MFTVASERLGTVSELLQFDLFPNFSPDIWKSDLYLCRRKPFFTFCNAFAVVPLAGGEIERLRCSDGSLISVRSE